MTVGERLRLARNIRKISGEALGRYIGVTKGQISNIEKGTSDLTKSNAIVLSDKLHVSYEWLMHGKGEMDVPSEGHREGSYQGGNFNTSSASGNTVSYGAVLPTTPANDNEAAQFWKERYLELKEELAELKKEYKDLTAKYLSK